MFMAGIPEVSGRLARATSVCSLTSGKPITLPIIKKM